MTDKQVSSSVSHRFQGEKFWIHRKRDEKAVSSINPKGREDLVLSVRGRDAQIFRDLLLTANEFNAKKSEGKTTVYRPQCGGWAVSTGQRKRPLETVVLDVGVAEAVVADIKDFIDSAPWYMKFAVPYRRGYLLHGPPGTGKTSFITAVVGLFGMNICIVNLADMSMNDATLTYLLTTAPAYSMILLDDIDAAFPDRDDKLTTEPKAERQDDTVMGLRGTRKKATGLTFSGLLNVLDGVGSTECRILFMTTNHVEKLDAALIRPGQVDVRQHVGYASEWQVERMYRRFNSDADDNEVQRFVRGVFSGAEKPEISMAQLQGLFLRFKNNPSMILTGLSMLSEKS